MSPKEREEKFDLSTYIEHLLIFDKLARKDNNEKEERNRERGSVLYQGEDRELLNRGITEIV